MGAFLYYVPGAHKQVTDALVAKAGLGYAFDAKPQGRPVMNHGPDGGAGIVLCDPARVRDIGVFGEAQVWRQAPGRGYWVGWFKADGLPGPEDLQRERLLTGHAVALGDERYWLVPVARRIEVEEDELVGAGCVLPRALGLTEDGEWSAGAVVPRYRALWGVAEQAWDVYMAGIGLEVEGPELPFDFRGQVEGAVTVLAANYRVSAVEADILGLLTEETMVQILKAVIDAPKLDGVIKKKIARLHELQTYVASVGERDESELPADHG